MSFNKWCSRPALPLGGPNRVGSATRVLSLPLLTARGARRALPSRQCRHPLAYVDVLARHRALIHIQLCMKWRCKRAREPASRRCKCSVRIATYLSIYSSIHPSIHPPSIHPSIHSTIHLSIYLPRAWPHPRVLAVLAVGALAAPVAADARRRGVRVIGGGVHEYVDLRGVGKGRWSSRVGQGKGWASRAV